MEILNSDTEFTPEGSVFKQLTLQECLRSASCTDIDRNKLMTGDKDRDTAEAFLCLSSPAAINTTVSLLSSAQECSSMAEDCDLLPPPNEFEVLLSSLPKDSVEEEPREMHDPIGVENSDFLTVSERTKTDTAHDSKSGSEGMPHWNKIVIKRKRRRILSLRDQRRTLVGIKAISEPAGRDIIIDSSDKAEPLLIHDEQKVTPSEESKKLCSEQPESGQMLQDITVPSEPIQNEELKDCNTATGDFGIIEGSIAGSYFISDKECISASREDEPSLGNDSSESVEVPQCMAIPPQSTVGSEEVEQKFSREQLESKNILGTASIKSEFVQDKSKPRRKVLSQKENSDVQLDHMVSVDSNTTSNAVVGVETECACVSSSEESSNNCEKFGSIVDDNADDRIVMVPSTPQEKEARRLARAKQLRNMRAWEMAEMRRERALRRGKRRNGEDGERNNEASSSRKRIKWKEEDDLVSVFEYSPKEEVEDIMTSS